MRPLQRKNPFYIIYVKGEEQVETWKKKSIKISRAWCKTIVTPYIK